DTHHAGRMLGQAGDGARIHAGGGQVRQGGVATRILAYGAHERRLGTQRCRVHGDIGGRTAEEVDISEHVPEHFTGANDYRSSRHHSRSLDMASNVGGAVGTRYLASVLAEAARRRGTPVRA